MNILIKTNMNHIKAEISSLIKQLTVILEEDNQLCENTDKADVISIANVPGHINHAQITGKVAKLYDNCYADMKRFNTFIEGREIDKICFLFEQVYSSLEGSELGICKDNQPEGKDHSITEMNRPEAVHSCKDFLSNSWRRQKLQDLLNELLELDAFIREEIWTGSLYNSPDYYQIMKCSDLIV